MPKKTQQKRRNSKKQKRSMKRNMKRSMRGGDVTIKYMFAGDNQFHSETAKSVQDWIKDQKDKNYEVNRHSDIDFGVYYVITQGTGM